MGLSFSVKLLLVLAASLVSVIVGMLAGLLAPLSGSQRAARVTHGSKAFVTSLTLLILVLMSLGLLT